PRTPPSIASHPGSAMPSATRSTCCGASTAGCARRPVPTTPSPWAHATTSRTTTRTSSSPRRRTCWSPSLPVRVTRRSLPVPRPPNRCRASGSRVRHRGGLGAGGRGRRSGVPKADVQRPIAGGQHARPGGTVPDAERAVPVCRSDHRLRGRSDGALRVHHRPHEPRGRHQLQAAGNGVDLWRGLRRDLRRAASRPAFQPWADPPPWSVHAYSFLVLSGVIFTLGAIGFMVRRNPLVVFMCIELMLNAVNLSFATISRHLNP